MYHMYLNISQYDNNFFCLPYFQVKNIVGFFCAQY